MLIFDLSNCDTYSFPIKKENISYGCDGSVFWSHKISYMKQLPISLYNAITQQQIFYILMSNEKISGYRKYRCDVIENNMITKEIIFNFKKVDFNKNELRKLKIKNLLEVL